MDFQLTETQQMLKREARNFAENEILPYWRELRTKEFPRDIFNKMVEAGYAGATIAEEYGGGGLDFLSFAVIVEELCRADAGVGLSIGASLSLVAKPIEFFGNEEQKRFWLPKIATGQAIGAYAQTEPDYGSNVAGIQTKAIRDGNELVISGTKRFITNGSVADVILAVVRTDPHPHRGLSMVIIDANKAKQAGTLIVDKDYDKVGLHCSPTSELTFVDCCVPLSNILNGDSGIGMGFLYAMGTLVASRSMIAAQGVGVAQAAFDEAVNYAFRREQFGKKLAEFQVIQRDLARMQEKIELARLMTYKAAWETDTKGIFRGEEFAHFNSMAKLNASEIATEVALKAMEIHGGMGYMTETRISAILLDSLVLRIYEGSSNIQEYIIARKILRDRGLKI